ncbi:hypothetical protein SAMN05428975_2512 [Mucilaginibacter sp. OK268]|uniref:hypothetical protein n=1 Tax=Mucilaginibacter sp. OK268 TaxID=1881048 RepID=UPI00088E5F79|nr:hypothetical protein [Mucilaginibacter sp. OK268]SDP75213.1 hypothetical protein SAMN05428975_2512 [Mucilaginibacter sp. OK268]
MRILLTNWINVLGVFLVVLALSFVLTLTDTNLSYNIFQSVIAALFLVCGFGMMFWALFIVSLVILDLIIIIPNRNNLKTRLIIEWLIISSPCTYLTIKYHEWMFVAAIIAFFITQLLREKRIKKLSK